jgi:hypothetical protein
VCVCVFVCVCVCVCACVCSERERMCMGRCVFLYAVLGACVRVCVCVGSFVCVIVFVLASDYTYVRGCGCKYVCVTTLCTQESALAIHAASYY